MSCCHCHHKKVVKETTPKRGELNNLDYLELCDKVKEVQAHAAKFHVGEEWKCRFFHKWYDIIDADYDTHRVCDRCGLYRSWENGYVGPEGY